MPRYSATFAAAQKDPSIADKWCLVYRDGIVEGTVSNTKKAADALLKSRAGKTAFTDEAVSKVGDALAKFSGTLSASLW